MAIRVYVCVCLAGTAGLVSVVAASANVQGDLTISRPVRLINVLHQWWLQQSFPVEVGSPIYLICLVVAGWATTTNLLVLHLPHLQPSGGHLA